MPRILKGESDQSKRRRRFAGAHVFGRFVGTRAKSPEARARAERRLSSEHAEAVAEEMAKNEALWGDYGRTKITDSFS